MNRTWKLGKDLGTYDTLLQGLDFDDLILAVQQQREISPETVKREFYIILDIALQDANFLIDQNMSEIIRAAMKGRNAQ